MEQALRFFVVVMVELAVLFVVVSTLVGLLRAYVSEKVIRRFLGGRWGSGNALGAAFGSIMPFCSISTIPVMAGLLRASAPFGPVASFLIASPLLNPLVLGLFVIFFGWRVAALYALLSFALAVAAGLLWARLGLERFVRELPDTWRECGAACEDAVYAAAKGCLSNFVANLRRAAVSGWGDFRRTLPYLVGGVAAGAVIQGFVSAEWIATVAGPSNLFAVPVAAVVAAPLYLWPETMLPLGAALQEKGMGMGTLMALVVGGAGASIPEVVVLSSVFKPRLLAVFLATVIGGAILVGYVFGFLFD